MERTIIINDLTRLIQIESVKGESAPNAPFGSAIRSTLDELCAIARRLGFSPVDVDGYAVYVELSGFHSSETVGVLAHLDVVPVGSGWTRAQGEVAEDRIYGRGAADDKGPALSCLYALAELRDSGFQPRRNIRLIFGCDEEQGSACMDYYAEKIGMPDIGFSPDSDFPLILFEKTILHVSADLPLPNAVKSVEAGVRPNVVPDNCVTVTNVPIERGVPSPVGFTRIDSGRSAHAMAPELGDSALFKAATALAPLSAPNSPFARFLTLCNPSAVKTLGLEILDDFTGTQTVNIGTVHTIARAARATFDFRCPKSQDVDGLIQKLSDYLGVPLSVETRAPYLYADREGELFTTLYNVYKKTTGRDEPPKISGGGTYARHMKNCVAFGPYFPETDNRIHEADEFLDLNHFDLLVKIYGAAMKALSRP